MDTEIDFTAVKNVRQHQLQKNGMKISYIAFIIYSISRILQQYPEANSAVRHSLFPKIAWYNKIQAKFTMDSYIDQTRVVLSGLIPEADQLNLNDIQKKIGYYRDHSFEEVDEFKPIRKLQSLPLGIGQWIYNKTIKNFSKREKLQGTFTVTSLGHKPIQSFYPIISSTTCFGVGSIQKKPIVVEDDIQIRPMMTLSLAFDHRAIDGAIAADILADVKSHLENISKG
ncbi:2-oxo acid dehydrogenase subunit E2 [Lentibacillus cibarius]|uniref:2-oxo acid dehydrogenase subunit E2 n=1 Tax=Lentibacillus cibarius TaxID=2583219 RepID=A0A5S3QGB3_9BACI|nr:2-oxo acid dehydrogenase subunit E2 [Lentibacillus cibarius]TMN20878.1 2-oxo acid dehydrogenase subunit E2 [Lentibacillus cibarius]